jgi:uncharacterized protein
MKRAAIVLIIFATSLVLCLQQLGARDVPALKARVNDYARMLSSYTEKRLEGILRDLEKTDSTQIVILTIPSLEGEVLEEFSIKLAETWKIGQKGLDNGAILLIAKDDRKIRIEVGYGLEGSLTDLMSGRIVQNVILPRFRAGNFDQGVLDGVQAMVGVVRGEYTAPEKIRSRKGSKGDGTHPLVVGWMLFVFLIVFFGWFRRLFGRRGSRRSSKGAIFWGGIGGGFSSGGFGGGFGGGGGGFGGGGASGGW